jgi:antitoxin YefM
MREDIISSKALRENLGKVMDEVCDWEAPVIITRQNKPPVVMMSYQDYRGMEETLHILSNQANAERLRQSIAQLNAGQVVEHDIIEPEEFNKKSAA